MSIPFIIDYDINIDGGYIGWCWCSNREKKRERQELTELMGVHIEEIKKLCFPIL